MADANLVYLMAVQGSGKKPYQITYHKVTGEIRCSCPAWCVTVPRRDCKHLKEDARPWLLGEQPSRKVQIFEAGVAVQTIIRQSVEGA
jgi:hypothetical protein